MWAIFRGSCCTANIIAVLGCELESERISLTYSLLFSNRPFFILVGWRLPRPMPFFCSLCSFCDACSFCTVNHLIILRALKVAARNSQIPCNIRKGKRIYSIIPFLIITCKTLAFDYKIGNRFARLIGNRSLCLISVTGNIYILTIDREGIHHIIQMRLLPRTIRNKPHHKTAVCNWIGFLSIFRIRSSARIIYSQIIFVWPYRNF